MSQTEISQKAQHLEQKLTEKDALASSHSAFAQELEADRRAMQPKDFAALCKEVQRDVNNHPGAGGRESHLPRVDLVMNKDGTVKKVDFKQQLYGGDVTNEVFIDDKCNEVHQEKRTHGMESESESLASNLFPGWTNVVAWVTDHVTADSREYHAHHDVQGHPVH